MNASIDPTGDRSPQPMMQAIVQRRYGGPETLELAQVGRPEIAENEVLVEVHCAGVDRGVWHLMTGLPYLVRLGFGLRRPRQAVIGLDLAGIVVAVGSGVSRFVVGDAVMGIGRGTYAEYAVATEDNLTRKPDSLSFESASIVAISGATALQAIVDIGAMQSGQRVLIIGASGGVGSFAVQIARAMGGRVSGVCSAGSAAFVSGLGAEQVYDYRTDDYLVRSSNYDLIIDCGSRNPVRRLRSALAAQGTLVIVGGEGGSRLSGGVERQLAALVMNRFVGQRLTAFIAAEHYRYIDRLCEMIEAGQIAPQVGGTYPLASAPEALADLARGGMQGKLVVRVRPDPS